MLPDAGHMNKNSAHILCIGKDPGLLRSRCAVLAHGGYDAQAVMFAEAESLLRTGSFDLLILSAILNDEERRQIMAQVGDPTRILILKKLIFASELLAEVERRLFKTRQDSMA
jgi:DNA-binding response OmpR family regulator